ncbi:MAG: GNAT family N-acetyltransferase [Caulobacterales bacterium 68-7]|nr:MAG: GNAT family N-acetyltransferase [Caulobacterales bacterium 68-7]
MALLDWTSPADPLVLQGDGVRLRLPRWGDYRPWRDLREQSRGFLQPWEPTWAPDDLSKPAFRRRLAAYRRELDLGEAYAFFIFRQDDTLVGSLRLSNVRRGVSQTATLGYWIGEPHKRRGHMSAAVKVALRFAFGPLGLHRVEAACIPDNHASANLLLKAGFDEEGYAQGYLKINGEWRDHRLFGIRSRGGM